MKLLNAKNFARAVLIGVIISNVVFSPIFESRLSSAAYEIVTIAIAAGVVIAPYLFASRILGKTGFWPIFLGIILFPIMVYSRFTLDQWIEEGRQFRVGIYLNYLENGNAPYQSSPSDQAYHLQCG